MRSLLNPSPRTPRKHRVAVASAAVVESIESRVMMSTVIGGWAFDNLPTGTNTTPTASTALNTASATSIGMTLFANSGLTAADDSNITSASGSSDGTASTNHGWKVVGNNGWNSAASIGAQGAVFSVSTTNYNTISVRFDFQPTAQGEGKVAVQYTLDGSSWNTPQSASMLSVNGAASGIAVATNTSSANTVTGAYFDVTGGSKWYNDLTVNLSSIAGAANDPNFAIRLVNAATGSDCVNSSGVALNNTSGNLVFDEVQVLGNSAVFTAPSITTQPMNQNALGGTTVSFTAAASGSPAPTVQWQVSTNNGVSFSNVTTGTGQTSDTYSFTTDPSQNNYQYQAVFTNGVNPPATTNPATLTVPISSPAILTQPISQHLSAGSTVTFTAAASGNPTPTVQWQVSTDNGATFQNVTTGTGQTANSYSFTVAASQTGYEYQAVYSSSGGSITTNPATLTVVGGAITVWSFPNTAPPADDFPTPTLGVGSAIPIGMDNTYTGFYSFPEADVVSSPALLDSFSENTWRIRGGSSSAAAGSPNGWSNSAPEYSQGAEFDISTAGRTNITLSFDWYSTTQGIRDLQVEYTLDTTQTNIDSTAGWTPIGSTIQAVPNDFYGDNPNGPPTGVFVNFQGIKAVENDPNFGIRLVAAYGADVEDPTTSPPTHYFNSQYAAASLGADGNAVIYNGSSGNWRFDNISLNGTTANGAPGVTLEPLSQNVVNNTQVTLSAAATGTPNPTVQWEVSTDGTTYSPVTGGNVQTSGSNPTTSTYTFTPTNTGTFYYEAVFTNAGGSATTTAANINVVTPVATAVVQQPSDVSVVVGNDAIFTASATGAPPPTVQWEVSTNGGVSFGNATGSVTTSYNAVSGITTTIYDIVSTQALNGNQYEVQFTNSTNSATSNPVTLTVLPKGVVITDWDFGTSTVVAGPDNSPPPTTGTGTASALGMTNDYTSPGPSTNYDDVTVQAGAANPLYTESVWRVRGSGPVGNEPNGWSNLAPEYTQGAEFDVNTTGYKGIYVTFDWFTTNQGIRDMQEQYTLDGTDWINLGSTIQAVPNDFYGATSNAAPTGVVVDLSAIPGAANNPNLGIRLVSAYDPGLPGYDQTASPPTGEYASATLANGLPQQYNGTSGNWRFDKIAFNGTVIPPSVVSTKVGNGSVQRSTINSFSVTFNTAVNLTNTSFTLYQATLNANGTVAGFTNDVSAGVTASSTDNTTWVFTGVAGGILDRNGATGIGDLADGVYELVLHGPSITDKVTGTTSLATGNQTMSFPNSEAINAGTGTAQAFHVLFGDLAGTAAVTNGDLNSVKKAFGPLGGIYNPALDFDNNGVVNNSDLNAFRKRFLETFSY